LPRRPGNKYFKDNAGEFRRFNPVADWITQLGRKQQIPGSSIDGLKEGDAKPFTDLLLAVQTKEPPMTFHLADCSHAEQLAVWEARTNYIGQHLQGAPLHQFAHISTQSEEVAIRAEIRSGSAQFSPNLIYETALRAVGDLVYDGKLPTVYHIQQLEKLTTKTTVEHYNKLYKDGLTYVTPKMMSERLQRTQWLAGMKAPTVRQAVEMQFIGHGGHGGHGAAIHMGAYPRVTSCRGLGVYNAPWPDTTSGF
jgi:hypothetical protein